MAILTLYAWARFIPTGYELPIGLAVSDISAGLAAITSVVSLVFYFWLPKDKTVLFARIAYLMIVVLLSVLIVTSGHVTSPFSGVWLLVAIFAGYFGMVMTGVLFGILLIQIIMSFSQNVADTPTIITYLVFGIISLVLGVILWHRQPTGKSDKSLSDLASRLSNVEGKSDVVINTIDDGVMAINRSGVIDLINPSAQTLLGWNKGDALGLDWKSVLKLVSEDSRAISEIDNPIAKSLATNKPTHEDKLFVETPSGKKRLVSIVSSPVGSSNDGVIVVFRDITREKAEERQQAEFISTASHEMRTPVASIEGYLGLALNPATANIDEKARDFITKAHESARYLGRLFQDLLDISKAEEGILKNSPKVIDVSAATGEIFESLTQLAQKKNLRYFFKPNPSLETEKTERRLDPVYYAHVDPGHFREVVTNLIENAIKYTPAGDVTVDVTGDSKMVTISIQDTGIGIPTEDIPHLFQKFYRVDNTDTREIGGTGLGLFLCRRLAEIIGGHLRVESTYRKGSTFFFDIPRMSHDEAMTKLHEISEDQPEIISDRPMLAINEVDNPPEAIDILNLPESSPSDEQLMVNQNQSELEQIEQPATQQFENQFSPPQENTQFNTPLPSGPEPSQPTTENYSAYTANVSDKQPQDVVYSPAPVTNSFTSMTIADIESAHTNKVSQEDQANFIRSEANAASQK